MNNLSSEMLGEDKAFGPLTEAESATERWGFFCDYLTSNSIVRPLLAYRLAAKT